MTGLTAVDPLGRSSTVPTEPSASVVVTSFAPPVSVQPVPSKLPALSPGINVYQLESCAEANGCENASGSCTRRVDRRREGCSLGAPCGQCRDRRCRARRRGEVLRISSQHIPSVVVPAAELSRDLSRDLWLCVPGSRRVCPFQRLTAGLSTDWPAGLSAHEPVRRMLDLPHPSDFVSSLPRAWPMPSGACRSSQPSKSSGCSRIRCAAPSLRLTDRELLAESLCIGGRFIAAIVGALVDRATARRFAVVPAIVCLLVLALSIKVRFDTPLGFTVATQLAFVPLLFAMPPARRPGRGRGGLRARAGARDRRGAPLARSRLLLAGLQCLVLGRTGGRVRDRGGRAPPGRPQALLIVAFAAQFVVDFVISAIRFSIATAGQLRLAAARDVDIRGGRRAHAGRVARRRDHPPRDPRDARDRAAARAARGVRPRASPAPARACSS